MRLLALGSLATKRTTTTYKKGVLKITDTVQNETTAPVFYHIAFLLGEIMSQILEEVPEAYFFWVDAVFIPKEAAKKVKAIFESHNLRYTIDIHKKIIKKGNLIEVVQSDGEVKPYQFNFKNICGIGSRIRAEQKALDSATAAHLDMLNRMPEGRNSIFWDCERDELLENIKNIFGTDEVNQYTKRQMLRTFNKYGLDFGDYLRVVEHYKEVHTDRPSEKDRIRGRDKDLILYNFIAQSVSILDPAKEYQYTQESRFYKGYEKVTTEKKYTFKTD